MAQEKPNSVVEWLQVARRQISVAREHFAEWLGAVREEPRLLWETTAIRYATYGVGGVALAWGITFMIGLFVPPPPASAQPEATTADFHVVCQRPECMHHFVIHRPFGFRGFPVQCSACKKETGVAARKCESETCRGRWVAPVEREGRLVCSRCGAPV